MVKKHIRVMMERIIMVKRVLTMVF